MNKFARCLVILFSMIVSSNLYAQEWVAYNQYVQPPIHTVYIQQSQPVIVYQWVPYTVQQNVIVEQKCLFYVNQTVVARPTVQWFLQPMVIYR